jgi:hypothetical protein
MQTTYKNCQSCGMPLSKDPGNNGMYCTKCFQDGQFTQPDIDTPEKMQALVKEKLQGMGFPGFIAGWFTKGIPKLERWRKS